MIRNKITPELKNRFSVSITSTRESGKEEGFYIYKDGYGNLSSGKTFYGDEDVVQLENPIRACTGKTIQGNFHTHAFLNLREAINQETGRTPSINEIKDVATNLMKWRYQDIGIEGMTSLNTPSYDDALKAILSKFENITVGTVCIGNDLIEDNVECWTVKENITDKYYRKAMNELSRRYVQEKSGKSNSQAMEKWVLSLFEKEIIDIKN